jgi:hypothetical protein
MDVGDIWRGQITRGNCLDVNPERLLRMKGGRESERERELE